MINMLVLVLGFTYALAYPQYATSDGLTERIVGGKDANITDYPYQLSLQNKGKHTCGASLIGAKWGVTAAHCTDEARPKYLSVRAGTSTREQGGQVVNIKKVYQHPEYSSETFDYDISVLEFESRVTHKLAKPISLAPSGMEIKEGSIAVITGWGTTKENGMGSRNLQFVKLPIVSKAKCIKIYESYISITDSMFCAGLSDGGKDPCQGDSGGPLAIDGVLTGVVSWGKGCARPKRPGVYTSIPVLRDYIDYIING